jgi:hypothetical protein
MKVTPLSDVPIIPYATMYHFDFLLPMKNEFALAPRAV